MSRPRVQYTLFVLICALAVALAAFPIVASDLFRIRSTAVLREVETTVSAVVRREKHPASGRWHCKVLSWRKN